ncbi:MAG: hypothetical protein LBU36_04235 [Clostridiales bacterium]|jgi:chromosome segregation ATPase|nr:hypothetical protein [Clostridiales bacterium]
MSVFTEHLSACSKMVKAAGVIAAPAAPKAMSLSAAPKAMSFSTATKAMSFSAEPAALRVSASAAEKPQQGRLKAELAGIISELKAEAEEKCRECKAELKILEAERGETMDEKAAAGDAIDGDKREMSNVEAEYAGKLAEIEKIQAQTAADGNKLEELRRKIENARKKKRDMEKWCWVPGYGLYLAIDCATDDDVKHYDSISRDMARRRQQMDRLNEEIKRLEPRLRGCEIEKLFLLAEIKYWSAELEEIIGRLNDLNQELVQWMGLWSYYEDTYARLDAGRATPEEIQRQLLSMSEELAKIA